MDVATIGTSITRAQFPRQYFSNSPRPSLSAGDAHNLAAHGDEFERLLHAQLRVHRVE